MRTDQYGQIILNESDICEIYLQNPERILSKTLVETPINITDELELVNLPELITYIEDTISVADYDKRAQKIWHMPEEYQHLDIAAWVLEQCKTDAELQRTGHELLLYQERDLFSLLQYMKYLVDTMRKHNITWGVGRGSSVSSYVLYLIGVHRINSMYYDLDINEFLR
jgi:DNA polymerase III alpha subunit